MNAPRILAFAGSVRRESFNRRVLSAAILGAEAAGAAVTRLELADLALPLFDEDQETAHGLPEGARRLKRLMIEHQGFLIACPEYNSSITPLLKNTLDWASRKDGEVSGSVCYRGKVVGLLSASAGRFAGTRGLRHVRDILATLGATALPEQFSLSGADTAFDAEGALTDDKHRRGAARVGERLAVVLRNWELP